MIRASVPTNSCQILFSLLRRTLTVKLFISFASKRGGIYDTGMKETLVFLRRHLLEG